MKMIKIKTEEDFNSIVHSWNWAIEDVMIEMMSIRDKNGILYATTGQKLFEGYVNEMADIREIFENGRFAIKPR